MATAFSVESSTPGSPVWSVDPSGNVIQSGSIQVTGTTASAFGTVGQITTTGVILQNNGINSSGSVNVLSGGTIGAGLVAILGTAANGTQLADLTRDYMVYLGVTAGGAAATLTIGPANTAVNTLYAAATCNVGTQYAFRVPAGWYIRFQGTAGITQQIAISC